jgi:tRNA (adenine22-N1)-methyltransferase
MLNNRISNILSQIKLCKLVVDIGSDHAQLAIQLLKQNKANHVINIEINNEPFLLTKKNLQKANLLDKTTNILSDGLKTNFTSDPIDYCVIAGMGAKNIVNIINSKNKHLKIKHFILVPNDQPDYLRYFLKKMDFKIMYEEVIFEKNRFYSLLVVNKKYGLTIMNKKDTYFGPYNLKFPTTNFQAMYQNRMNYIENNKLYAYNPCINKEYQLLREHQL